MTKNSILLFCTVLLGIAGLSVGVSAGSYDIYLPVTLKAPLPTATPTVPPTAIPTAIPTVPPTAIPTATPSTSSGNANITHIEYNPPGSDAEGEYVDIQNTGDTFDMVGWKLYDNANTTYTFPSFTLAAGASVRVWVRSGTNDGANLYWGRNSATWNNNGDCGHLKRPDGTLADQFCY